MRPLWGKKQHANKPPAAQSQEPQFLVETPLPAWRRPIIGYLCVLPILVLTLLLTHGIRSIVTDFELLSGAWIMSLALIALFWGLGPTLLMFVLGLLALDYFFLHPIGKSTLTFWPNIVQLLPLGIAALTVAWVITQLERERRAARLAEKRSQIYNEHLQAINQQLETMNQRLTEADQTKDRFLSIVSHELKTPVTGISMLTQLLRRRITKQQSATSSGSSGDDVIASLQHIEEQTKRMTGLINELLDVGRIESGQIIVQKQSCDLNELCEAVVAEQRLVTEREITLNTSSPITVFADHDRLVQVLTNLIGNATKYSPAGSPIEVSIRGQHPHVHIVVRDYGQGIDQEQLPHIFDLFYRTPDAYSSSTGGLGLGLAIVKGIVEQHDGRIWCESTPGQGSTFFVELPLSAAVPAHH